jgi:hypothetical protein
VSERAIELPERWKALRRLPLRLEAQSAVTMYWRTDGGSLAALQGVAGRAVKGARRAG